MKTILFICLLIVVVAAAGSHELRSQPSPANPGPQVADLSLMARPSDKPDNQVQTRPTVQEHEEYRLPTRSKEVPLNLAEIQRNMHWATSTNRGVYQLCEPQGPLVTERFAPIRSKWFPRSELRPLTRWVLNRATWLPQ